MIQLCCGGGDSGGSVVVLVVWLWFWWSDELTQLRVEWACEMRLQCVSE